MNLVSKNENLIWLTTAVCTVVIGTLYQNKYLIAFMSIYWLLLTLMYLIFGQSHKRSIVLVLMILLCVQIAYFSFFGLALAAFEPLDNVIAGTSLSKQATATLFSLTSVFAAFVSALPLAIIARKTSGKLLPLFVVMSMSGPIILGVSSYGIVLMVGMFIAILSTWWASPNKLSQRDAASGAAA